MKRTRKNQILAGLALFAILFSVISTAILVVLTPTSDQTIPQEQDIDMGSLLKQLSGSVEVLTGNTLTGSTK